MFENVFKGSIYGSIGKDLCRLTPNGQIAVKTSTGYKSYNLATKKLINQSNFVFDIGEDFFFVLPINKVKPGDIILVNGKPRCVVEASKTSIQVVNYENSTLETVLPERHVFMGNTYFYGKIVSLLGSNLGKKSGTKNLMKTMFQIQMMQQIFGSKSGSSNGISSMFGGDTENKSDDNKSNMLETMMYMSMMGGSGIGDIFGNMFDFDDDDEDTEEGIISSLMDDSEEETDDK